MLKQYFRSTIIVLIQSAGLALLIMLLIPLLLEKSDTLTHINHFLNQHKSLFLLVHVLFYLALFLVWPYFIQHLARKNKSLTAEQIQKAIQIRYHLTLTFLVIELLSFWR